MGAHRTNFTGSVLEETDIKIGSFKYYLDYLEDSIIRNHNLDIKNYGNYKYSLTKIVIVTLKLENMFLFGTDF